MVTFTGKASPALHEIHIFLHPLNPDEETVSRFQAACREYNETMVPIKEMKACHLSLFFKQPNAEVRVMQSSRYLPCDSTETVLRESHADATFFRDRGFTVLREKIEASAYGILEIPLRAPLKTGYFEFHIRCCDSNVPVSEEDARRLNEISDGFSEKHGGQLIPLSYNKTKHDSGIYQRYFNVRFREHGLDELQPTLNQIKETITSAGFKVSKTISEFVWFDTMPELDKGWIE